MPPKALQCLIVGLLCVAPLIAQKVEITGNKPQPTEWVEQPWVIGTEVMKHWRDLPNQVNAPTLRTRVCPGQHLTLAVGARGDNRDQLLKAGTYSFTITVGAESKTFENLRPTQTRRIKAEGADFVLSVLKGAQVNSGEAESLMSVVSIALFDLDWVAPVNSKERLVTIKGKVAAADGTSKSLKDAQVEYWSYERSAKEGGFKNQEESGKWMMAYYQQPEPSRLLHMFRLSKDDKNAFSPHARMFSIEALKSDPGAAKDLISRLTAEDPDARFCGMVMLDGAGYDFTTLLESLPEREQDTYKMVSTKMPSLPDPYDLTPSVDDPSQVPTHMDMLWSIFLATGDAKPVRAIASVLEWRKDGKAFLEIRKSGKKIDKVTPEIVRGVAYMASGWSLGSFYRNYPLVTDYIEAWKKDANVPQVIREELGTLMTNEAFKRN